MSLLLRRVYFFFQLGSPFRRNVAFTTVFGIPVCQPDVCLTVLAASWFTTNIAFTIARCQLAACPDFAGATFLLEKPTNGVPGRQPDARPSVDLCRRSMYLLGKSFAALMFSHNLDAK